MYAPLVGHRGVCDGHNFLKIGVTLLEILVFSAYR